MIVSCDVQVAGDSMMMEEEEECLDVMEEKYRHIYRCRPGCNGG